MRHPETNKERQEQAIKMNRRDLTNKEISDLSLEMRCCYFLYPWNHSMTITTVQGWAEHIGFVGYDTETSTILSATRTAIHEANELIAFVKDEKMKSYKLNPLVSERYMKILEAKIIKQRSHIKSMANLVSGKQSRIDELETLLEVREARIIDMQTRHEMVCANLEKDNSDLYNINKSLEHDIKESLRTEQSQQKFINILLR